jgi:hypothetical protein
VCNHNTFNYLETYERAEQTIATLHLAGKTCAARGQHSGFYDLLVNYDVNEGL